MVDKMKEKGKASLVITEDDKASSKEIQRYQLILEHEPSSLVFAALAEAFRKKKQLKQAIDICKKGLRVHPNFMSGRVALARACADAGKIDEARKELEKVVLATPDNLVAQRLLANIYKEKHDLDRLEKALHHILAVDAQDKDAKEMLRWIEGQQGVVPDSVENKWFQREIVTRTLAEIYALQGYHEKAFEIYRKLSWQQSGNPIFHRRLAELKEKAVQRMVRMKGREDTKGFHN